MCTVNMSRMMLQCQRAESEGLACIFVGNLKKEELADMFSGIVKFGLMFGVKHKFEMTNASKAA